MSAPTTIPAFPPRFRPDPNELLKQLPAIADRVHAQLHELQIRPTPDGAERLGVELGAVQRHVLSIREVLARGREDDQ